MANHSLRAIRFAHLVADSRFDPFLSFFHPFIRENPILIVVCTFLQTTSEGVDLINTETTPITELLAELDSSEPHPAHSV